MKIFNMKHFFLLSLVLCQRINEISSQDENAATDTKTPSIYLISVEGKKDTDSISLAGDSTPHYSFHAGSIVYILNHPLPWKNQAVLSSSFINADKEFNSDYTNTIGIGLLKLHTRKLSWNRARRICTEEGAHLAVIRTDSEEKIILQLMLQDSIDDAWLGLHDKFEEGEWVTVMDEPLGKTGWAKWSKNFPNNPDNYQGKQHCARIVRKGGGMDDDTCELLKPFVCKISNH